MIGVKPGTDPLEAGLAVLFGISAVINLVYGPRAGTAGEMLPPLWRVVWLCLLLAGCATTLAGVVSRRISGLYLEYVGLMAMGTSITIYGIGSLAAMHARGIPAGPIWYSGMLVVGLGVSLLLKWRQIDRDLRTLAPRERPRNGAT